MREVNKNNIYIHNGTETLRYNKKKKSNVQLRIADETIIIIINNNVVSDIIYYSIRLYILYYRTQ